MMAKKFAWLGQEDLDDTPIGEVPPLMETPAKTIESAANEMSIPDNAIDNMMADGDTISDDVEELEKMEATVAATTANADGSPYVHEVEGQSESEALAAKYGVDEVAAKIVEPALERLSARYGYRRMSVAKECFADAATRKVATEGMLSDIKGTIAKAWAAFVAWLKGIYKAAKDKWLAFSNLGKSSIKRGENLIKAVSSKDFGALKSDKFKVGLLSGWGKMCTVDNKLDINAMMKIGESCDNIANGSYRFVDIKIHAAMKTIANKLAKPEATEKATKALADMPVSHDKKMASELSHSPDGSNITFICLPNNSYLAEYAYLEGEVLNGALDYFPVISESKERDFTPLTPDEMKSAANTIVKTGKCIQNNILNYEKNDKLGKQLVDKVDAIQKTMAGAAEDEIAAIRISMKIAKQNVKSAENMKRASTGALKNVVLGLAGAVGASMAAYKAA